MANYSISGTSFSGFQEVVFRFSAVTGYQVELMNKPAPGARLILNPESGSSRMLPSTGQILPVFIR